MVVRLTRVSFAITVISLVVTFASLVISTFMLEPGPLTWSVWAVWGALVLANLGVYRLGMYRGVFGGPRGAQDEL